MLWRAALLHVGPEDLIDPAEIPIEKLGAIAVFVLVLALIMASLMWRQFKITDRIMETVDKLIDALSRRNGK